MHVVALRFVEVGEFHESKIGVLTIELHEAHFHRHPSSRPGGRLPGLSVLIRKHDGQAELAGIVWSRDTLELYQLCISAIAWNHMKAETAGLKPQPAFGLQNATCR